MSIRKVTAFHFDRHVLSPSCWTSHKIALLRKVEDPSMAEVLDFTACPIGTPTDVKRKVPQRRRNKDYRTREYLTEDEVNRMLACVSGRYPKRDKLITLAAYRHGLRVSELTALRFSEVDLKNARLHVRRLKNGLDSTHPLQGDVLRLLRAAQRAQDYPEYVFLSERGAPLTGSSVRYMVRKAGDKAGLTAVHPHQLRHRCGYYFANKGVDTRAIQEYLGHRSITHTNKYTQLAANRFVGLWDN